MRIKLLEPEEIPELFDILSDPDISGNLMANPEMITKNNLFQILLSTKAGTFSYAFAVYSKDILMGVVTINDLDRLKNSAHIGAVAVKSIEESGMYRLGLKAAKWLIDYCFESLNLNRIYAHTWDDNNRMGKLYKRLKAVKEGTEREHSWKKGKYVDMHIWSILRSEWEARRNGVKENGT